MASRLISHDDESHTTDTIFIVGGYVGAAADSRKLDFAWRRRLLTEGITEFHAVDCAQATGAFKGWTPERRETLQGDLAKLLLGSGLVPVVTAIQLSGWAAVADRIRLARPRQSTPYHLGFEHQITLVAQQTIGGPLPIDFVFDKLARHQGGAKAVFDSLQRANQRSFEFARRLRSLDFGDSSAYPGLQAADFLAYESKRHLEVEWGYAARKNRTQWFEILVSDLGPSISNSIRFFNGPALSAYAAAAEGSAARRGIPPAP
jgi:hypothetical protein